MDFATKESLIGLCVAAFGMMARRVIAFIGMVAVVLLALAVVWKVYQHRRSHVPPDEPTIVTLSSPKTPVNI